MTMNKIDRARSIIDKIRALDITLGTHAPARGVSGAIMGRYVQVDPRWSALFTPGYRIAIGRHYEDRIGERYIAEAGCKIFRLEAYRRPVLVANLRGDEIALHSYYPGLWESWFAIDNGGDTAPHDPWPFGDPGSPTWQALAESDDFKSLPLRKSPEVAPPAAMLTKRQRASFGKRQAVADAAV